MQIETIPAPIKLQIPWLVVVMSSECVRKYFVFQFVFSFRFPSSDPHATENYKYNLCDKL
jgi:hypothetical protein